MKDRYEEDAGPAGDFAGISDAALRNMKLALKPVRDKMAADFRRMRKEYPKIAKLVFRRYRNAKRIMVGRGV